MRSASGANSADIAATIDLFRTDLGGANNGTGAPAASGRREINWDGVPDNFASPNNLPANFFNVNSPRGVVFTTPGTGFQVSANNGSGTPEFGDIDPVYPSYFATHSPQRLFTARGSTITDVEFFVPGTTNPATVSGFGAVFTDVDSANVTSIQVFGLNGVSFGTFFVPNAAGNQTLSFLGISFNAGERIARVRITCGNQVLAPGNAAVDSVVMDDFIYGEPQINPVRNVNTGKFYPTIQTAIVAADTVNGHVIEVKPGTYSEQVLVNKSVTLRGAKADVDGRSDSRGSDESVVRGVLSQGQQTGSFDIGVSGVTIDGFTIQDAQGNAVLLQQNISGTQIRNNVFKNNLGSVALANLDPKSPALIERNRFEGDNSDNTLGGVGRSSNVAGPLRNVVINDNTFVSLKFGAISLSSNEADSQSRIVISNNVIDSNNDVGIHVQNIVASKITRNTITKSGGGQIRIGGGANGLTIEENVIQNGQTHGLGISKGFGGAGVNNNIEVNCNRFEGNAQSAIVLTAGGYNGALDATGNWWGSATGPTIASNPAGSGQPIIDAAGQIDYSGFLTQLFDQQFTAPGFQCSPAATLYGVDTSNRLLRFRSFAPSTVLGSPTITGLQAGETIRGIDFRPSTGELFAIGSDNRLYVIDPLSGAATFRGALSVALSGTGLGIAFDPQADAAGQPSLRVVTNFDQNLLIDASTGAVTTETAITPAAVNIDAIAYTNDDADPQTGTALLGYDFTGDQLVKTAAPASGSFATGGASGYTALNEVNMDVQTVAGRDVVFMSLQKAAGETDLYRANKWDALVEQARREVAEGEGR